MESPQLWTWERHLKLLLVATLAYAFLFSLLRSEHWRCVTGSCAIGVTALPLAPGAQPPLAGLLSPSLTERPQLWDDSCRVRSSALSQARAVKRADL
jgi:hypothetical protein